MNMQLSRCKIVQICSIMVFAGIIGGCAVPSQPTGGPPDKDGPVVMVTEPETGTVNFKGQTVQFEFDEYINRKTLEKALRIEPNLNIPTEIDWGKRSLKVKFGKALPDSTTVIVTLGTDLTDVRGNKMTSPVAVAFSTGPAIDDGRLKAKLKDAKDGKSVAGGRVLLYRVPVDYTKPALYTGESDTSGLVTFSYLAPGRYKAFWLEDKNRNRKWDREIEMAQPFFKEFIELEEGSKDSLKALYVQKKDTLAPGLQAIGLLSTVRLRLRFSETVVVADTAAVTITDTLGNFVASAVPLYRSEKEPFIVFAQSRNSLQPGRFYLLQLSGIFDPAQNPLKPVDIRFEGSAQQDTTLQRIIRTEHKGGLFSDQPFALKFARLFRDNALADSLIVIKGEETIRPWKNVELVNNRMVIRPEQDRWEPGVKYEIRVFNPGTLRYKKYEPTLWFDADVGAFEFVIPRNGSLSNGKLQLEDLEGVVKRDTSFTSTITIDKLPPKKYHVRIYDDQNNNGKWDKGRVAPYQAPEPIFIRRGMEIKSGFTATVPIEL